MMITAIGNRLKEAREKKAITLDEVHAKIKIHPRIIQILEEEKFEKLPSPLFAKSFLKSYAEFLEVNPEEILDAYDKQGKKIQPEQILYLKTADERIRETRGFRNLGPALGRVVVALLCVAAVFYVTKHFHDWTAFVWRKAVTHETPAKDPARGVELQTKQTAAPAAPSTSGEWLRSPKLENFPKLDSKRSLDLKIKALDNVWLHITCDGKVLFQSILKKGAVESWSADKSIRVWSGNASNMSLDLNKHALGSPGKGSVNKMLVTHEGVKAVS